MSIQINCGTSTGKSVYFLAISGGSALNVNTLALDSFPLGTYSNYVISATEKGTTGIYNATFPTGAPAGDYDIFPYESFGGSPAQGDSFAAGSFTIHWNGYAITSEIGSDVDSTVALITLNDAKNYLKVTTSNDDAILAVLINSISAWVQNYLNRKLVSASYTEYYSGDGSDELQLVNYPITAISSIYIDDLREWAIDTAVDVANNIIIKKSSGIIQAFDLLYGFSPGESNIKITYTAGYSVGIVGGAGTVPHEIRLAVKRLLDKHYRLGYSQRKLDNTSESIAGMNLQFDTNAVPDDVKSMLSKYRKMIPAPQFEYAD